MDAAAWSEERTPLMLGPCRRLQGRFFALPGLFESPRHGLFAEISLDDRDSRYRRHLSRSTANTRPDRATRSASTCDSARCGTEVDDGIAGTREPVPLQELEQLKGRARPVPCALARRTNGSFTWRLSHALLDLLRVIL